MGVCISIKNDTEYEMYAKITILTDKSFKVGGKET